MRHDVVNGILFVLSDGTWRTSDEIATQFGDGFCAPEFEDAILVASRSGYLAITTRKKSKGRGRETIYSLTNIGTAFIKATIRDHFRLKPMAGTDRYEVRG